VVQAADPGDRALDTEAEAGVWHRAIAPQIQEPLERCSRQLMVRERSLERLQVILALAAADDFAVAFRGEDVDTAGHLRVVRSRFM